MTEIPEHLLKRSKERREAIGGGDAPAEASAPAGEVEAVEAPVPAAPTPTEAAVPEPAPVPEPVRPEVAAALSRRKIPYWALPMLAALPLWAYVYQATLEPAPTGELTPLEAGAERFAGCASCHGANGGGNAGAPGFAGVTETWPDFRDHMMWVRIGNKAWLGASGEDTYGANDTPTNNGLMPDHPSFTDEELAQVVLYERVEFGGMEESGEEYEQLLAIAEGDLTFAEAGLGELSQEIGLSEDDLVPG